MLAPFQLMTETPGSFPTLLEYRSDHPEEKTKSRQEVYLDPNLVWRDQFYKDEKALEVASVATEVIVAYEVHGGVGLVRDPLVTTHPDLLRLCPITPFEEVVSLGG